MFLSDEFLPGLLEKTSRRLFLQKIALGSSALFIPHSLLPGSSLLADPQTKISKLITRVARPANLETPVSEFTSWITSNDLFFVRSHFGPPATNQVKNWKLTVTGEVAKPLQLTLSDLKSFGEVTLPLVIQCAGNGRAFHRPRVPGVSWERGAVGNAEWTGVRLRDVLQKVGIGKNARHAQLQGADRPLRLQTPLFIRSIPIEKALDPYTLLAYKMNGEPLPLLHGYPLRIIVPGWGGEHSVKWLTNINLQEEEASGFYMQTAYRMPKKPLPAGAPLDPADSVPLTTLVVKSLIARPVHGSVIKQSEIMIQGVAFTGEGEVTNVEVSIDGGKTWDATELGKEKAQYAWRLWSYRWKPAESGKYTICSRATDSNGNTQPEIAAWNPSGYLWNGIDRVDVEVAR